MKSYIKSRRAGLTLIEVIITLAILGIVLISVTQFLSFNLRTFSKGEKIAEVQFDVRMASDYVSSELRDVMDLSSTEILDGERIDLPILQTRFSSLSSIRFDIVRENNRILVEYDVTGNSSDGANPITMKSKVLLNNDRLFKNDLLEASNLNVIYFKK